MKAAPQRPLHDLDFKNALAGPLIVILSFFALSIWTWQKGGDFFTDFGNQLYFAWRLSTGEKMYSELTWIMGPLSHHLNALVFKVWGVAVQHLLVANLAIIILVATILYALILKVSDRLTACVTTVATLGIFCFGHLLEEGVFNFLTPYSHEATHGTVLCLLLVWFLDSWQRSKRAVFGFSAGICVGLTFLTKVELAAAALGVGIAFLACSRPLKISRKDLSLCAFGVLLPPLLAWIFFLNEQTPAQALGSTLGAFSFVTSGEGSLAYDFFQRKIMGLDDLPGNAWLFAKMCLLCLALTATAAVLDRKLCARKVGKGLSIAIATLLFALLFLKSSLFPWLSAPRFLLLLCPAVFLFAAVKLRRLNVDSPARPTLVLALLWAVFSIILLARLGIAPVFYHYGFFMALPAFVMTAVLYLHFIPVYLQGRYGGGFTFRCCALAFILAALFVHLRYSEHFYAQRTYAVGEGRDRLFLQAAEVSEQARLDIATLERMKERSRSGETLAVIPSGALLNYYLRSINPTGISILVPNVMRIQGEALIVSRFQRSRPSRILITEMDPRETGFGTLGKDPHFMLQLWSWIRENYALKAEVPNSTGSPYASIFEPQTTPAQFDQKR